MRNEKEVVNTAKVIIQIKELLQTLSCESGLMENAEKIHGFDLVQLPSVDDFQWYAVKYKEPGTNKRLPTKTIVVPKTTDYEQAVTFAIANKDSIIQKYIEKKAKKKVKTDSKEFYQMLKDYYVRDSTYMKDDEVNNKEPVSSNQRDKSISFINNQLIPFLEKKNINSIQEVSRSVYSDLKIYLKEECKLQTKTINNRLTFFNRILKYCVRNDLIAKLPYSEGTGHMKMTPEEKASQKKAALIPTPPTEKGGYKDLFELFTFSEVLHDPELYTPYLLALLGITTGMRPEEVMDIKWEDFIYVKESDIWLLKVFNRKTKRFHNTDLFKNRRIPLHPYFIKLFKPYKDNINPKPNANDYVFPYSAKADKETGEIHGYIPFKRMDKAMLLVYKGMKKQDQFGYSYKDILSPLNIKYKDLKSEMIKKRYSYYSFRTTFNTLCQMQRGYDPASGKSDDTIDYFMGHIVKDKQRDNYSRINELSDKPFFDAYGHLVIEVAETFIFNSEKEKAESIKNVKNIALEKGIDLPTLSYDEQMNFLEKTSKEIKPVETETKKQKCPESILDI